MKQFPQTAAGPVAVNPAARPRGAAFFLLYGLLALGLAGCSAQIKGALKRDGSADISLQASLQPRMAALIRSLSALGTDGAASAPDAPVIDGPSIARSMAAAPGIAKVSLANSGPSAVEGTISIAKIDQFLVLPPSQGGGGIPFIRYAQDASGGRLLINLDLKTGPQLVSLISPEVSDYLAALMAPVASGEAMSRSMYLVVIESIYGAPVAGEIAAAKIQMALTFPGPVTAVKGGSARGNTASFEIPLLDLLVLETPLSYEVSWN